VLQVEEQEKERERSTFRCVLKSRSSVLTELFRLTRLFLPPSVTSCPPKIVVCWFYGGGGGLLALASGIYGGIVYHVLCGV